MEGWVALDKSLLNGAKKNLIKHCIGWLCRSIGRSCIEGGRVAGCDGINATFGSEMFHEGENKIPLGAWTC